jgi:GLPGLI family protein
MIRIKICLYLSFCLNFNIYSQEYIKGIAKYRNTLALSDSANRRAIDVSLFFTQQESIFKDYTTEDFKVNNNDTSHKSSSSNVYELYKNIDIRKIFLREMAFMQRVIVEDSLINHDWKIGKEKRKIGKFDCQNAEVDFRGRHYIAWFTLEIPVSNGPWKFHGLPGLIVEVSDTLKQVKFELLQIQLSSNSLSIKPPLATKKEQLYKWVDFVKRRKENKENYIKQVKSDPNYDGGEFKIDIKTIEIFSDN